MYGTTIGSVDIGVAATVFKIILDGVLKTLAYFVDGEHPYADLVQATDGNFYGTSYRGGYQIYGTVFRVTPDGDLTTVYNFCSQPDCTDGAGPFDALVQATNGKLYGTTSGGGAYSDGTVFVLSVGSGPFAETIPTSGKVGARVTVLGNNLTGTTGITFNGVAATFTVVSSTEITTTVPSGATTGSVQVTTAKRTLTSNVPFRVTE